MTYCTTLYAMQVRDVLSEVCSPQCRTFIFHLLRRDNQPPVACAMWQARSSGKPSACPYAARSTHISHTHLAHTSRFELGSPRVSPGGGPPRPATGTVTAGLLLRQLGARCATLPLACMCLEPRAHVLVPAYVCIEDRSHGGLFFCIPYVEIQYAPVCMNSFFTQ